jgi:hypothetical protein
VKFPTPPAQEKVKSQPAKLLEPLGKAADKVVTTKERKDKGEPPVSLLSEKPERDNPFWCEAHGFCHGEQLPDHRPDCVREW